MKKKRPMADRKYKEVRKFISDVFNREYGTNIFNTPIVLDDNSTLMFKIERSERNYTSYWPSILINDVEFKCERGKISRIPTKDLHIIYRTLHDSFESILFQIHL